MEHYVTLFDSLFLPQGLALHRSMERHCDLYTLWILCIDQDAFDRLKILNLPHVQLLNLNDLECAELKAVRATRSLREYCWTLTPISVRFVFEADKSIQRVTYLDADTWFRKNPKPVFQELDASSKGVLITDHAYAPEYDVSIESGQYCVQFVSFNRKTGEQVRAWWEDRCKEWCYAKSEDGKFGDQKYLDQWPILFEVIVHIAQNKEWFLAPWNATRFPYGNAIFWHFQGLRLIKKGNRWRAFFGTYPLPKVVREYIYSPYLKDLRYAIDLLSKVGIPVASQFELTCLFQLKNFLRGILDLRWRANQNLQSDL